MNDSVAHAADTVPVAVVVDVDRAIAPLVLILQSFSGVRTYASCAGHPHSEHETRAYVLLSDPLGTLQERFGEVDRFYGLEFALRDLTAEGDLYLYVKPEHVERLARALA